MSELLELDPKVDGKLEDSRNKESIADAEILELYKTAINEAGLVAVEEYSKSGVDPRDRNVNETQEYNVNDSVANDKKQEIQYPLGSLAHAKRVESSSRAFAGEKIGELVHTSSVLHDMFGRMFSLDKKITDETMLKSEGLLKKFFSTISNKCEISDEENRNKLTHAVTRYICGIGIDQVQLSRKITKYRQNTAKSARSLESGETVKTGIQEVISSKYKGEIPPEVWSTVEPEVDFSEMFHILKDTNLEAVYVIANELLDNIRNPSSKRESALIQDILEAESSLAPMLELVKFDGLASALRDVCHQTRLIKSGKGHYVEESREHLEKIAELGMDKIMQNVLGVNVAVNPAVGVDKSIGKVPVYLGDAKADGREDEIYYRLKTIGSRANKMSCNDVEPMDDMAMSIVSENVDKSATAFAEFIKNKVLVENSNLRLHKPSDKNSAIRIQGPQAFTDIVKAKLDEFEIDPSLYEIKIDNADDIESRGYENLKVAKLTFMAEIDGVEVPTEIQFLTKDERSRMRRGPIAHIIYKHVKQIESNGGRKLSSEEKCEIVKDAVRVLAPMTERSDYLNPKSLDLNGRTEEMADEVLYIMQSLDRTGELVDA